MSKRNLLMKPKFLKGNTASLCLNNFGGIVIKISDDGDGLEYQFQFGENKPEHIYNAEIDYLVNEDGNEEDGLEACFYTECGQVYFLSEFMRDNYGR